MFFNTINNPVIPIGVTGLGTGKHKPYQFATIPNSENPIPVADEQFTSHRFYSNSRIQVKPEEKSNFRVKLSNFISNLPVLGKMAHDSTDKVILPGEFYGQNLP